MKTSSVERVCALFLVVGAAAVAAPAQTFTTLVNLDVTTGTSPDPKPIVQGTDGNFYGTAGSGGKYGLGTAFKMTPQGVLTVLYNFCSLSNCSDGASPNPGVVLGADGNYYGVTTSGGANNFGEIFKMNAAGKLTVLHSFNSTDGAYPLSALVQGADRAFYGTTLGGGNLQACSGTGCGNVFKVTPGGKFTALHNFCEQPNCTDGGFAFDGLAVGSDGYLYGGTWNGGQSNLGTIYRISPYGAFTTLYSFCQPGGCPGGDNPLWMALGNDGNFYGTTLNGGNNGGGAVFRMTPSGNVSTVYSFCAKLGCTDGANPHSGLWLGSDGNFYGNTYFGGTNLQSDDGTVFKVTPDGSLTTLHSFSGVDGQNPIGGMGQGTNGVFYGTTLSGGSNGYGTIFSISEELAAFVQTAPGVGRVGQHILILGTGLTGAISVTLAGVPAPFNVVSPTLITAIVPTSTGTGVVQVVTPGGTLSSSANFLVVP